MRVHLTRSVADCVTHPVNAHPLYFNLFAFLYALIAVPHGPVGHHEP